MDDIKNLHRCAIKARLNKAFVSSQYTCNKLKTELTKELGYEINYDTLRNTLSPSSTALDIYCVIAICKHFNLDIAYVLSSPNDLENELFLRDSSFVSERFSVLNDPQYMGVYYGYFYSTKRIYHMMDRFRLEIKRECNTTTAHMNVLSHSVDDRGETVIVSRELVGTPVFVQPSNIYIVLTEATGQFIILSFSYVKYNRRNLYFRRGAMLTLGRDASRQPLMQSFVLFDKPVDKSNEKYIPGFLLIYDSVFHISENKLMQLKQTHLEVQTLFDRFSYIFNAHHEMYYTVNEAQILASADEAGSNDDTIKALQLMKACATDAKRVYFPDIDDFSEFSKGLNRPK